MRETLTLSEPGSHVSIAFAKRTLAILLTVPANARVALVHDLVPHVVNGDSWDPWLDATIALPEARPHGTHADRNWRTCEADHALARTSLNAPQAVQSVADGGGNASAGRSSRKVNTESFKVSRVRKPGIESHNQIPPGFTISGGSPSAQDANGAVMSLNFSSLLEAIPKYIFNVLMPVP